MGRPVGSTNKKLGRPKGSKNRNTKKGIYNEGTADDTNPDVITLKIMLIIEDYFPIEKALSTAEIDQLENSIHKTIESIDLYR